MINEHDIKDMMDDVMDNLTEEERQVDYKEEDGEIILDMQGFLLNYTKNLLEMLDYPWGKK